MQIATLYIIFLVIQDCFAYTILQMYVLKGLSQAPWNQKLAFYENEEKGQ